MGGISLFLTVAALIAAVQSHMIMQNPIPFNAATIDNSPLDSSGANFPCKSTGQSGFYQDTASKLGNIFSIGQSIPLSFKGSAVHGGGSCQLAVTTDKAPTPKTIWSVILSIEGGCPSEDGTTPSTYNFTIPSSVPAGDYVFAWTWTSKESGAPEYYMNCAPISVKAASSKTKRHLTSQKRAAALPNLAAYNLASINSCKSTLGSDPTYPAPGPVVSKPPGATRNFAPISGSNCFPGGTATGDLAGGSGGGSAGNSSGTAASSPAAGAGSTAAAASPSAAPSGSGSDSGSGSGSDAGASAGSGTDSSSSSSIVATPVSSGGVTAQAESLSFPDVTTSCGSSESTDEPSSPAAAPSAAPSAEGSSGSGGSSPAASAAAPSATPTGDASGSGSGSSPDSSSDGSSAAPSAAPSSNPSAAAPSAAAASASPAAPASSPSSSGSAGSGGSSTAGGLTGACTNEGIWNCISGSSFQRCASGQWSAVMAMPGGTSCTPGQSQDLWARTWDKAIRRFGRRFAA